MVLEASSVKGKDMGTLAQEQATLQLTEPPPRQLDAMGLLQIALQNNAAIDVIERIAALQREASAREALLDFNEALSRVQKEIKRVVPDLENKQTNSRYASYDAINKAIRPIYSREGFSLSFTHADCPKPEHVRVICRVALRAHIEHYQIDMPLPISGPKGNAIMSATHGTAAADSYAKRYLVKDIFNISIGEDDDDGNLSNGALVETLKTIEQAFDKKSLWSLYNKAVEQFESNATAIKAINVAKRKRADELEPR